MHRGDRVEVTGGERNGQFGHIVSVHNGGDIEEAHADVDFGDVCEYVDLDNLELRDAIEEMD
jgi:hypothetical protein